MKLKILFDSFDNYFLSKYGLVFGIWEFKLMKFLLKKIKKNDIFYDVGVNNGFYSFLISFLILSFCKEVHLFEPLIEYTDLIRENIYDLNLENLINKKIFINNLALNNKNGEIFF